MDSECLCISPRVCDVLAASGSSSADDTSSEKSLDWFTTISRTGVTSVEACPCSLDFSSKVAFNSTTGTNILSFTLKLAGLVGSSEDGFKVSEERSVLKSVFDPHHWQEAGLWEDPSSRIGWIQGSKATSQHSEALRFFVQADLIEQLSQLQTDSSLFVASAANQMLVNVSLVCQSSSSVGCNGTNNMDLEHNSVGTEVTHNCNDIISKVFEYSKKSVVSKETSHLPRSQQILKLSSSLSVQVRPPSRDTSSSTIIDSSEESVTNSCSQLTLSSMDVLLAANSSLSDDRGPKQRIVRLSSLMSNIRKPEDVIQGAAASLHSHQKDPAHSAHSARVSSLPSDIVTGILSVDKSSTATEELRIIMTEQLKSKSCISMMCVCLRNTPQITSMASDCSPCPPRLIVSAVLSLSRSCRVDSPSSAAGCVEVVRFVTGNSKVQKCASEASSALSKSPEAKMKSVEVFKVSTEYSNSPSSEPSVLHKSYQALLNWIGVCTDLSCITEQLREDLIRALRKRACDMHWEARDSTVEFSGHLTRSRSCQASTEDEMESSDVLSGGCGFTLPILKEASQDPESYVRASSISALSQISSLSWQQGAALTQEQVEIVTQSQEILSQDSEGFARRAVVKYFIAWFSSCPSPTRCLLLMQSVPKVLSQGLADSDWEVKLHTSELAESSSDRAFPDPAPSHPYAVMFDQSLRPHTQDKESVLLSSLNSLVDQGVVLALFCGSVDCDRPVASKACQSLLKLRDAVCPSMVSTADTRVSCEQSGPSLVQEIRMIQGMKDAHKQGDSHIASEACSQAAEESECANGDRMCVGVCEVLRLSDLDEKSSVSSQSSDHVYNSPLSLSQDISTTSTASSHPSSEPGQEVIVDCY